MSSVRYLWDHKPCVLVISPRGVSVREADPSDLAAHDAALDECRAKVAAAAAPCADAPVVADGQVLSLEEPEPEPESEHEREREHEPASPTAPAEPKPKRAYSKCTHGHPSKKLCEICSKQKRAPRKKPVAKAASAPAAEAAE
jgi:hypothetical protein